jgi:hypothetical protein
MILLSELSRRRIRSVQKLIRVGRNEVVVVMRVDPDKGECGAGLQEKLEDGSRVGLQPRRKGGLDCFRWDQGPGGERSQYRQGDQDVFETGCS